MEKKSQINAKEILRGNDPVLGRVEITYNESFPEEERRPFSLIRNLIDQEPLFRLYAIEKESEYAGFITVWDFNDFSYIEHFAIDPAARSGGIGGRTIELIKETLSRPIVLEVELPTDELSQRRIGFYERLGFVLDNHTYIQPPYQQGFPSIEMRLMSYGEYDLNIHFEQVKDSLHRKVYGVQ